MIDTEPSRRLADAPLCVLVNGGPDLAAFSRLVTILVEAGVPFLQVRDKVLPPAELAARVRCAVEIARRARPARPPLVIVNDRVELVAACEADGAHVGADDLPTVQARALLDRGPAAGRRLLGRTAHDLAEAMHAVRDGADYLGVGPCHPSATKAFAAFAPREFLAAVAGKVTLPVFAIGGITVDRLDDLLRLGIRRFAVASAITAAADPGAAARGFLERIAAAAGSTHEPLSASTTARAISASSPVR